MADQTIIEQAQATYQQEVEKIDAQIEDLERVARDAYREYTEAQEAIRRAQDRKQSLATEMWEACR